MARASDDQATHAVADQHYLLDRYRPVAHQALEQVIELPAVVGDVTTGVVAQVDGAVPEVAAKA
ncbi:MAG TPA: hypothetical protein VLR26_00670 [Frankiaceae bacterium]|nr:hypothetical protein [Frankiaceae bacterium]